MTAHRQWIRAAGAGAVGVWCLLGLAHTGVVMSRPTTGWLVARPAGAESAIGVPREHDDGSALVTEALGAIEAYAADGREFWLVRTDTREPDTWLYLQMQLSNVAYPRHFYLAPADSAEVPASAHAIGVDGAGPGAGWVERGRVGRATIYERSG